MQPTELGTSVAPRQRPKGNVSSQNLPLVLPSSPSPRAFASPSPQVQQTSDSNGETTDKSSAVHSTPTKSGNLFEASFSTNFTDTTTNLPQSTPALVQSPTSPLHQSLLNAPKTLTAGHRRISSDTTAFNKYPTADFPIYFVFANCDKFFFRTFANETNDFGRLNLSFGPVSMEAADMADKFSGVHLRSSNSSADLPSSREQKSIKSVASNAPLQWNPFEDQTPFDQMSEDHIYEAEFDTLRDRPSGM